MTVLSDYLQRAQALLGDTKQEVVNPGLLQSFINTARGQIAGEGECIRFQGIVVVAAGHRDIGFSNILTGTQATNGVRGVIHVRSVAYNVGTGQQWVAPRTWEWFEYYCLNTPVPASGPPTDWAQFQQGAATIGAVGGGGLFINPVPDLDYTLICDSVCYPQDLLDDTYVEALPYLWTDAVPYFAVYLAYLNAQKPDVADAMFKIYKVFVDRARKASNPSVNRWMYQQSIDPTLISKLGLQQKTN